MHVCMYAYVCVCEHVSLTCFTERHKDGAAQADEVPTQAAVVSPSVHLERAATPHAPLLLLVGLPGDHLLLYSWEGEGEGGREGGREGGGGGRAYDNSRTQDKN